MDNLTLPRKARRLAKELLKQAIENEPQITADLQNIAWEISGEVVGLKNKFKTEISLVRKLIDRADFNSESIREIAESVNDVLRYTFILPFEIYAKGFRQTIETLRELGYQIPENRIWNAWQTAGKRFDKGYRGVNITIISSQKQNFELQFHSAESFRLKTETHFLYEEVRSRKTSKKRKSEIIETLIRMAENIKRPEGI